MKIKANNANDPIWKEISVRSSIPEALKPLDEIAHNMWWSWNSEVSHLFQDIDKDLWKKVGQNPVLFLARMNYAKLEEIAEDEAIVKKVKSIYADFRSYMDVKPDTKRPSVAYLCMEYGLSHVLKIYSGGLGILAGDYLKEASDSNVDLCAVGFLYRFGYFTQTLSMQGDQIANYEAQNFGELPIEREIDDNGEPVVVDVPFNNYTVHAYVWRVNVGRIKLYLLDTDNEMNSEYDRSITHSLYGGDWENRLKQEILLGIGGILTLKKLGIKKDIYHCNEGHAALCNVQRLADFVADRRAATPTAAAELATPNTKVDILQYLATSETRLTSMTQRYIVNHQEGLTRLQNSVVFRQPERLYDSYLQKVDNLTTELNNRLRQQIQIDQQGQTLLTTRLKSLRLDQKIATLHRDLASDTDALKRNVMAYVEQQKNRAEKAYDNLSLIDPVKIVKRGFSIARTQDGDVIKSVKAVTDKQVLDLEVSDGKIKVEVKK